MAVISYSVGNTGAPELRDFSNIDDAITQHHTDTGGTLVSGNTYEIVVFDDVIQTVGFSNTTLAFTGFNSTTGFLIRNASGQRPIFDAAAIVFRTGVAQGFKNSKIQGFEVLNSTASFVFDLRGFQESVLEKMVVHDCTGTRIVTMNSVDSLFDVTVRDNIFYDCTSATGFHSNNGNSSENGNVICNNSVFNLNIGVLCGATRSNSFNLDRVVNNMCLGNTDNWGSAAAASMYADFNMGESGDAPLEGIANIESTAAVEWTNTATGDFSLKDGALSIGAGLGPLSLVGFIDIDTTDNDATGTRAGVSGDMGALLKTTTNDLFVSIGAHEEASLVPPTPSGNAAIAMGSRVSTKIGIGLI